MSTNQEGAVAREFSKVAPAIWRSKKFRALGDDARLVHLYLITCEHQNSAGCYRLPVAYGAADMGWPVDRFETAFQQVSEAGLIACAPETEELFIRNWFRVSPPMNLKHGAGIMTIVSRIESDALRLEVEAEYARVRR